jgi:hypothetical protein
MTPTLGPRITDTTTLLRAAQRYQDDYSVTLKSLAKELGYASHGGVRYMFNQYGIPLRRRAKRSPLSAHEERMLAEMYSTVKVSQRRIGALFGVTGDYVATILKRRGVAPRPAGVTARRALSDEEELNAVALYMAVEDMTCRELGEHYGISEYSVGRILRRHGVDVRPRGSWRTNRLAAASREAA